MQTISSHSRAPSDTKSLLNILSDLSKSIQNRIDDRSIKTDEYSRAAEGYIDQLLSDDAMIPPANKVSVKKVLCSIQKNAVMCGGEEGTRYTACAIVDCATRCKRDGLIALAGDWLKCFLLPCE